MLQFHAHRFISNLVCLSTEPKTAEIVWLSPDVGLAFWTAGFQPCGLSPQDHNEVPQHEDGGDQQDHPRPVAQHLQRTRSLRPSLCLLLAILPPVLSGSVPDPLGERRF